MVVENNQPTGPYDHLQVIQVDKYVMKRVTAVDEGRIRYIPSAASRGNAIWDRSLNNIAMPSNWAERITSQPAS